MFTTCIDMYRHTNIICHLESSKLYLTQKKHNFSQNKLFLTSNRFIISPIFPFSIIPSLYIMAIQGDLPQCHPPQEIRPGTINHHCPWKKGLLRALFLGGGSGITLRLPWLYLDSPFPTGAFFQEAPVAVQDFWSWPSRPKDSSTLRRPNKRWRENTPFRWPVHIHHEHEKSIQKWRC